MSSERSSSPFDRIGNWRKAFQEHKRSVLSHDTARSSLEAFKNTPCYDPLVTFNGDSPSVFDTRRLRAGTVFRLTEYILPSPDEMYQWFVTGDKKDQMQDIFYVDTETDESLTEKQTGLFLPDNEVTLIQCRIQNPYFPVVQASEQIIIPDIPDEMDTTEIDTARYLTKQIDIFSANAFRPRRV